jgi:hypothetical protein
MKSTEIWLGVCIYAAILLASFSSRLYPLMNKPLWLGIETFWHSQLSVNHGSVLWVFCKTCG